MRRSNTTPSDMNVTNIFQPMDLRVVHQPGTYALLVRLHETSIFRVGRLGLQRLDPGNYVYVGSALGPGGLHARLQRHLRPKEMKRSHWHIDKLSAIGEITEIWWATGTQRWECNWASMLARIGTITPRGFGASDCRCPGHLILLDELEVVSGARQNLQRRLQVSIHRQAIMAR